MLMLLLLLLLLDVNLLGWYHSTNDVRRILMLSIWVMIVLRVLLLLLEVLLILQIRWDAVVLRVLLLVRGRGTFFLFVDCTR